MKIKTMAGICLAATAAACSIKQNVQPVSLLAQQEICVIQNDAVRAELRGITPAKYLGFASKLVRG
mgnify:CR=1 FL=1